MSEIKEENRKIYITGHGMMSIGGKWLGAARGKVQRLFRNGSDVTWGSADVLEPHATVGQVEKIAACAVAAYINEDRSTPFEELLRTAKRLVGSIDEKKLCELSQDSHLYFLQLKRAVENAEKKITDLAKEE